MPNTPPNPWMTFTDVIGLPSTPFPLYSRYVEEFIEFVLKLIVAASIVWISGIQTLRKIRRALQEDIPHE